MFEAMDLFEELEELIDVLVANDVEYALCGGLALAVHGYSRFTKDIDLLVRREDVERAVRVAGDLGYTVDAGEIPFDAQGPHSRTVRRISKVDGNALLTLDLVILPDWLADVWRTRESFEWEGRRITVVSRAGLVEMKRVAGRPQDLADLDRLEGEDRVEDSC